jgi:hypothetical protein
VLRDGQAGELHRKLTLASEGQGVVKGRKVGCLFDSFLSFVASSNLLFSTADVEKNVGTANWTMTCLDFCLRVAASKQYC